MEKMQAFVLGSQDVLTATFSKRFMEYTINPVNHMSEPISTVRVLIIIIWPENDAIQICWRPASKVNALIWNNYCESVTKSLNEDT